MNQWLERRIYESGVVSLIPALAFFYVLLFFAPVPSVLEMSYDVIYQHYLRKLLRSYWFRFSSRHWCRFLSESMVILISLSSIPTIQLGQLNCFDHQTFWYRSVEVHNTQPSVEHILYTIELVGDDVTICPLSVFSSLSNFIVYVSQH